MKSRTTRLEIQPGEVLVKNGFPSGSKPITQDDFPAVIKAIVSAADAELGAGASRPAARANEATRKRQ